MEENNDNTRTELDELGEFGLIDQLTQEFPLRNPSSLKGVGEESFVNANDGSCEGMVYPDLNCFTVQFHPEAASGPLDTAFLFDRFIASMAPKGGKRDA